MTTDEREDEEGGEKDEGETAESAAASEASLASEAMAAEPEAESGATARSDESAADHEEDDGPAAGVMGTRGFGIERYIQGAFAVLALVIFWVLQQTVMLVWNLFTEPNATIATGIAAGAAIVATIGLYRHERFSKLAREIAVELSKVTWPSREELQVSTVVVIVTSVVAAIYMGVLDAFWSALTDLLYTA